MPYNAGQPLREDDEDQPWRPGGNVAGGVPQGAAPGPTGPGQGPGTGGSVGSVGGAGRFVNFGRMFDLNKEKATQTANRAVSGLDETARQAQGQLAQAQGQFQQAAASSGTGYDSMRGMGAQLGQPTTPASTSGTNRQGSDQETTTRGNTVQTRGGETPVFGNQAQQTVDTAMRPWTRDELAAGAAQTYTGPTELDTSALEQQFGGIQDRARALGQPGGIEAELARQAGGDPTQSTGNSRWEAGLAGVAGAETLGAASNRYQNFGARLADARLQAAGQAAQARDRVAGQAAAYQQRLSEFDGAAGGAPTFSDVDTGTVTMNRTGQTFADQLNNQGVGTPDNTRAVNNFARWLQAEDPDAYTALVNNRLTDAQVQALVRRQRAPRGGG